MSLSSNATRMTFDLQPTLKGELLELWPLRREDFRDLYLGVANGVANRRAQDSALQVMVGRLPAV